MRGRLAETLHRSSAPGAQTASFPTDPPSPLHHTMRIAPLDDAEVELSLLSPRARDESETGSETLVHDDIDIDEEVRRYEEICWVRRSLSLFYFRFTPVRYSRLPRSFV